jgi:hypothetical protein
MVAVTEHGARVHARLGAAIREVPPELAALSADDQRALRDILRRALG